MKQHNHSEIRGGLAVVIGCGIGRLQASFCMIFRIFPSKPVSSIFRYALLPLALSIAETVDSSAQHSPDIVWSTNAYILGKQVISVAFSSDGAMLASCLGRTTSVWRVSDCSFIRSFQSRVEATSVAFAPDQSLLGIGDGAGNLVIWRLADGIMVTPGGLGQEEGDDTKYSVTFSPDSWLVAPASQERGLRYISQAPTFITGPSFDYPEETSAFDVRFSPDGALLAASFDDRTAKLYRISEGRLLRELGGHNGPVTSVDFSPDGALLATSSTDGDMRLWRVPEGTLIRTISGGGGSPVISLGNHALGRARFSADGKSLLTLSNGAVRFWSVSDGRLLLTYPNLEAFSIAVSPDGKHFAYGTGSQYGTNAAVVLARMPLLITDISQGNDQFILGWSGGNGLYQLQSTTNVADGPWQNVGGPTTATVATNAISGTVFYRVQNLPSPVPPP